MFIKQVFYGVLRYTDFLKIVTESLFVSVFRLNELPLDDFKSLVIVSYTIYLFKNVLRYSSKTVLK